MSTAMGRGEADAITSDIAQLVGQLRQDLGRIAALRASMTAEEWDVYCVAELGVLAETLKAVAAEWGIAL